MTSLTMQWRNWKRRNWQLDQYAYITCNLQVGRVDARGLNGPLTVCTTDAFNGTTEYCLVFLSASVWRLESLTSITDAVWLYCVYVCLSSVLLENSWTVSRAMLPSCAVRLSVSGSAPSLDASCRPLPTTENACRRSISAYCISSFQLFLSFRKNCYTVSLNEWTVL